MDGSMVSGLFLTLKVELSFPNRTKLMYEQLEDDHVAKSRAGACPLPPSLAPDLTGYSGLSSMLKDP